MGITFTEFLLGKDVRSRKTGRMARIERVNSVNDIIGRPLFISGKDSPDEWAEKRVEHLCFLDIETGALRQRPGRRPAELGYR